MVFVAGRLRIAVVGARGIGKHHAKWFALEGADVVAIAGSSESTAAQAARQLERLFGFAGAAYGDVRRMLDEARPDAVSIATPPELHAAHARLALEAGAHVLCEKPLVWHAAAPAEQLLSQARELLALARGKGLELCVMTQYVALVPLLRELAEVGLGPLWQFGMKMESKPTGPRFTQVWVDLGPHPLALLAALEPSFRLVEQSLQVSVEELETRVAFDFAPQGLAHSEQRCSASIVVGKREQPERIIELNGTPVRYEGRPNEQGVFSAYLTVGERTIVAEDPMRLTIRSFLARCRGEEHGPIACGEQALYALQMLLRIAQRCREEA